MFPSKYCEIFKNTFLTKPLQANVTVEGQTNVTVINTASLRKQSLQAIITVIAKNVNVKFMKM